METPSYSYRTTRLVLHNCLSAVAEFVSNDDSRSDMNGVWVDAVKIGANHYVRFHATDGHTWARVEREVGASDLTDRFTPGGQTAMIPRQELATLIKELRPRRVAERDEPVVVELKDGWWVADGWGCFQTPPRLRPPRWDAVVPQGLAADPVDRLGIDPAYLARVGEACRRLRRHLPHEGHPATLAVRVPHADGYDPVMFAQRTGCGLALTMLVAPKRL